jgi:hypothetical protein
MNRLRRAAIFVAPFALGAVALASAQTAPDFVPMSVIRKCAEIGSTARRLACYDKIAEGPSATASAEPPAAAPKESFGLYSAEHPKAPPPPVEPLITEKVISIGSNSRGRVTVTLTGDQVWELDSADPVLATGDLVTVKRATLGSFILTTPAGRLHRVHRIH